MVKLAKRKWPLMWLGSVLCISLLSLGCADQAAMLPEADQAPSDPPTAEAPDGQDPDRHDSDRHDSDGQNLDNQWLQQLQQLAAGESDTLHMVDQAIDDRQLASLAELPESAELRNVLLDAGKVTDVGLQSIARWPVEHLRLRFSPITDDAFRDLSDDPQYAPLRENLAILNLPQAELTAAGVRELQAFPRLFQLRLGGGQIDDQAIAVIAQLPQLRSLHLIAPQLSDRALDHLAMAPKLTSLYLDQCPLADDAWQRLFEAKPNLHVHIDQAHHDLDPKAHPH